jgi:predicted nucleotidyltransferase
MLELLNRLKPFFEDTHREYSVREYGRLCKMSPPTASTLLKKAEKTGLLISRKQGIYIYFRANRESSFFRDISKAYWRLTLKSLLENFSKDFLFKKPVLFGSIAKVENTSDSDIDLFLDIDKKNINLNEVEKIIKRKLQIHFKDSLKNENLKKNIEKGVVIE